MDDLLPLSKQIIKKIITNDRTPLNIPNNSKSKEGQKCFNVPIEYLSSATPLDLINSGVYARNRILRDKCNALAATGAGVEWKPSTPNDTGLPYTCPQSLTGTCTYGHCMINREDTCMQYSKIPFDSKGEMIPENKDSFYLEWRKKPWGSSAGATGCFLGNYAFRRWCEIPSTRDPEHPDTDSADKFLYIPNIQVTPTGTIDGGTCQLTESYCHHKNERWDDSDPNNKSCYKPGGQKFAEALFGRTIDAVFNGHCEGSVSSDQSTAKTTPMFRKLSDRRLKERLVKLADDYGGKNVHLYLYSYTPEALKMHPGYKTMQIGFVADEVETLFPDIIVVDKGYKYISFTIDQLKEKRYWRIINTIKNEHIILKAIMEKFMLTPGTSPTISV